MKLNDAVGVTPLVAYLASQGKISSEFIMSAACLVIFLALNRIAKEIALSRDSQKEIELSRSSQKEIELSRSSQKEDGMDAVGRILSAVESLLIKREKESVSRVNQAMQDIESSRSSPPSEEKEQKQKLTKLYKLYDDMYTKFHACRSSKYHALGCPANDIVECGTPKLAACTCHITTSDVPGAMPSHNPMSHTMDCLALKYNDATQCTCPMSPDILIHKPKEYIILKPECHALGCLTHDTASPEDCDCFISDDECYSPSRDLLDEAEKKRNKALN